MTLNAEVIANWVAETRETYGPDRAILYALGVGAGRDCHDVPLVFEDKLRPLPTMAVVLGNEGFWQRDPKTGADWRKAVQGDQSLVVHRPLPVSGTVIGKMRVEALVDKGPGGHALIRQARDLFDEDTGALLATCGSTVILREQGGFGGARTDVDAQTRQPCPGRPPDVSLRYETRPEQAAIYRLSGDRNPLHIDYDLARDVGYLRPILHGLCTYGFSGRAIVAAMCDGDAGRLRRLDARFTAPVYPGENLVVDIWRTASAQAAYRVTVEERGVIAIDDGRAAWA